MCLPCRYSEIGEWMKELTKVEEEVEAKTDRWLELAEMQ